MATATRRQLLGGSLEAPWRLPEGGAGGRGGGWGGSPEAWVRPGRLPGGSLRGERAGEAGGRLEAGWRQAVCTMAPVKVDASTLSSYWKGFIFLLPESLESAEW